MDINKLTFSELDKRIRESFSSEYGPGDIPIEYRTRSTKAAIVPTGNFEEAGPIAAWAWYELGESEFGNIYLVVTENPVDSRNVIIAENVKTPFGIVKSDKGVMNLLTKNFGIFDEGTDVTEYSNLLFQLPYLQFASKDKLKDLKVVYMLIGHMEYEDILNIAELLAESNMNIILVVSNNFLRFGEEFGYVPFKYNVKTEIKNITNFLYTNIVEMKSKELLDFVELRSIKLNIRPVVLAIEFAKNMGIKRAKFLRELNTSEVTDDYTRSINYASFIF